MVIFLKPLLKQHKVYITRLLYLNGIPFNVSNSSEFWYIHKKHYNNNTVLSRDTLYDKVAQYYQHFFIVCAVKLTCGIQ